ncbi:hypothetical protein ABEF95_013560 [Exophiala dermatitidis]
MSTSTMTTTLGTSNVRGGGPSRQTRVNPKRVTRGFGSGPPRYNSLTSASGLPLGTSNTTMTTANTAPASSEPPRLYPAITHFADAIAALPREFRRHNSLLKEVDAKAWEAEENLQNILRQCLSDPAITGTNLGSTAPVVAGPTAPDDPVHASEINSVTGASLDTASLASARSADPAVLPRRQQFHALRQHLMAIMVTMDEKNHVINNANEEVAKHIRRLDKAWSHLDDEISEEARLGSLRHWAYPDLNAVKKPAAPATRKDGATGAGTPHENEAAHRSEARREAVMARRHRNNQHAESDFDETKAQTRKTNATGKKRAAETAPDTIGLGISGTGAGPGKRKKAEKPTVGGVGMERSISNAVGGRAMSRENSQQENAKKRKASTAVTTVARKRINAATQDSPKLASSPLAGTTGKEAYKRSPALSNARPAGRGRQNSTQGAENTRGRPSSSAANKPGGSHNVTASTPELHSVAAVTGKSTSEVKNTMKETKTDKGDRLLEDKATAADSAEGEPSLRGALLLESSASGQEGGARDEPPEEGSTKGAVASPRLPPPLQLSEIKNERRGRASKTSTPVAGSFAEAEETETGTANGSGSGNNTNNNGTKPRRPARPRVKDHGLHDSLSPKGLPMKRPHKKSGSFSAFSPLTTNSQRLRDEPDAKSQSGTPSERGGVPSGDDNNNNSNGNSISNTTNNGARGDEEEADGAEEDEERYCYCQGVSYGEMVACDKEDCPRQWFHLECIGLKSVPKSAKWYCDECKEALAKKGKVANGGNGGNNGNGK